jgi:Flp pilus assembly protein TadD
MAHYRHAMQLNPKDPTAHYNLAVGFVRKGQLENAVAELRTVLRIQAGYPDAEGLLNDLLAQKAQP